MEDGLLISHLVDSKRFLAREGMVMEALQSHIYELDSA